jgi:squalene-associated FAD-dependent desaturase
MSRMRTDVIIVGGGVAGLACASELARLGAKFVLVEKRRKLGGRATSFRDVKTGLELDNCQHVALGCCTAYIELLKRLGASDQFTWQREQYWMQPGGHLSVIEPSWLPCPGQFGPSMLRAKFLSWTELAELSLGMAAVLAAKREVLRGRSFASFLREAGQGEGVCRKFWQPVTVSACNLGIDEVDASVAIKPFLEGFLASRDASMIGVPRGGLGDLYRNAAAMCSRGGGIIEEGASARGVWAQRVELEDGRVFEAERVVCCVPFERAVEIVDGDVQREDQRFDAMRTWRHSPIIGVHLGFGEVMSELPNVVLVDAPHGTQWLFFKKGAEATSHDGQTRWTVHAVISAADAWVHLPEEEIAQRVMEDLQACLPAMARRGMKQPLWHRVVKERRATFAATSAFVQHRPTIDGSSGLLLAGDYVDQDWPSTMEGAARAGFAAAQMACGGEGLGYPELAPAAGFVMLRRLAGQEVPRRGVYGRFVPSGGAAEE